MKTWPQQFIGAIVAAGCLFAAMAPAKAETCSLELKRLEQTSRFSPEDYMFRATFPQSGSDYLYCQGYITWDSTVFVV